MRNALLIFLSATLFGLPLTAQPNSSPTADDAAKFIQNAESKLDEVIVKAGRADWVGANFITDDTQEISSEADEIANGTATAFAKQTTPV